MAAQVSHCTVVAFVAPLAFTLAACGSSDSREPDRVVGIEWRCTHAVINPTEPVRLTDLRGAEGCEARDGGDKDIYKYPEPSKNTLLNRRQELTVRTSTGTSYTVNVPPSTKVALNDEWPPK